MHLSLGRSFVVQAVLLLHCILMSSHCHKSLRAEQPIEYQWLPVTLQAPWASRDGAGLLSYRDQLYLLGGWNPSDRNHFPMICSNDVWSSRDGSHWELVKKNTFLDRAFDPKIDWEGRHTAGYAVFQDKMWIIGGDCNQRHYQNDVWQSSDGAQWHLVTDQVPWAPRALHYTLVHNHRLWVLGGQTMRPLHHRQKNFIATSGALRMEFSGSKSSHKSRVGPRAA